MTKIKKKITFYIDVKCKSQLRAFFLNKFFWGLSFAALKYWCQKILWKTMLYELAGLCWSCVAIMCIYRNNERIEKAQTGLCHLCGWTSMLRAGKANKEVTVRCWSCKCSNEFAIQLLVLKKTMRIKFASCNLFPSMHLHFICIKIIKYCCRGCTFLKENHILFKNMTIPSPLLWGIN